MACSRKHYEAIASVIANVKAEEWVIENDQADTGVEACNEIACRLSDFFASDSPLFNESKFLRACDLS